MGDSKHEQSDPRSWLDVQISKAVDEIYNDVLADAIAMGYDPTRDYGAELDAMEEDDTAHLANPPREVCSTCGHVAQYRDDVRHDATGVWHGPTCGGYYVVEEGEDE